MIDKAVIYANIKKGWVEELKRTDDLPTDIAKTYKRWVHSLINQSVQLQQPPQPQQGAEAQGA